MPPLLILIFHTKPGIAIGTDLVYASITKLAASLQHIKQMTVDFKAFWVLCIGSVPGAVAGTLLISYLEHHLNVRLESQVIDHMLGITYVFAIFAMIWMAIQQIRLRSASHGLPLQLPVLKMVCLGLLGGHIVGLTSVGSGSIYVAILGLIYPLAGAQLVGTDILQGMVVTGVAGLVHMAVGNVDLHMVASLLIGSIPGILIGSRIVPKLPDRAVRAGIVLMLAWSSWTMFGQ